mgnify:CR=1 FL=1
MGKKKKVIVTTVIRYLIILIFCVPMIMPLLWMLTTALKDNAASVDSKSIPLGKLHNRLTAD